MHSKAEAQHTCFINTPWRTEWSFTFSKCGTHQVINLYFNWHLPKHRALSQEKDLLWDLRAQCGQEDSRIPQALHTEHQPCRRMDPGGSASPPRHLAHQCPHMSQLLPSTKHCWIWLPQNEAPLSKEKHHKQKSDRWKIGRSYLESIKLTKGNIWNIKETPANQTEVF